MNRLGLFHGLRRQACTSNLINIRSIHSTRRAMQLLYTPKEASASPDAIFVDSTWFMPNLTPPRSGYEEWKRRRIPGARYIDLDKVASPHPLGLKHMMPSGEVLAKACGKKRIVDLGDSNYMQKTWASSLIPK